MRDVNGGEAIGTVCQKGPWAQTEITKIIRQDKRTRKSTAMGSGYSIASSMTRMTVHASTPHRLAEKAPDSFRVLAIYTHCNDTFAPSMASIASIFNIWKERVQYRVLRVVLWPECHCESPGSSIERAFCGNDWGPENVPCVFFPSFLCFYYSIV